MQICLLGISHLLVKYPLGAELESVHLEATDLDANAISVATSDSTPSGGMAVPPVIKFSSSSTKDSLSVGTLGPVSWKDSWSRRRERELNHQGSR